MKTRYATQFASSTIQFYCYYFISNFNSSQTVEEVLYNFAILLQLIRLDIAIPGL